MSGITPIKKSTRTQMPTKTLMWAVDQLFFKINCKKKNLARNIPSQIFFFAINFEKQLINCPHQCFCWHLSSRGFFYWCDP